MRRYLIYAVMACFIAAAGGYSAYRYIKIVGQFSFDLIDSIRTQDSRIEALERACRSRKKSYCFESVSSRVTATSSFGSKDSEDLIAGCLAGSRRACLHDERMNRALTLAPAMTVWTHPEHYGELQASEKQWPRVVFLPEKLSLPQWKTLAYQSLSVAENRKADLVCTMAAEFKSALVCLTYGSRRTSLALARVSALTEQDQGVLTASGHRSSPLLQFWQGYNIRRNDFIKASAEIRKKDIPVEEEESLWKILLSREWDFLLTFNLFSIFSGIPSHEYLHGVYFESEDYRKRIDAIVGKNPLDLLAVRSFVKSMYKTSSKYVLNNEIQAYALQDDHSLSRDPVWKKAEEEIWSELIPFLSAESRWSTVFGERLSEYR